jgi:hypothetical protein
VRKRHMARVYGVRVRTHRRNGRRRGGPARLFPLRRKRYTGCTMSDVQIK